MTNRCSMKCILIILIQNGLSLLMPKAFLLWRFMWWFLEEMKQPNSDSFFTMSAFKNKDMTIWNQMWERPSKNKLNRRLQWNSLMCMEKVRKCGGEHSPKDTNEPKILSKDIPNHLYAYALVVCHCLHQSLHLLHPWLNTYWSLFKHVIYDASSMQFGNNVCMLLFGNLHLMLHICHQILVLLKSLLLSSEFWSDLDCKCYQDPRVYDYGKYKTIKMIVGKTR